MVKKSINIFKKIRKRKKVKGLIIAGAIIALLLIISLISLILVPRIMTASIIKGHVSFDQVWTAEEFGLTAETIDLDTADGLRLAAYEVYWDNPRAIVIFLSGIHEPSVTAFYGHAGMLLEEGYSSILLEMRAHGESEGELIGLGYKEHLDVQAAVDYIKDEAKYEDVPVLLYGLSMGGATAINAAALIPEIDGLISMSAYSSWDDVYYDNMLEMGFPKTIASLQKGFVRRYINNNVGSDNSELIPKNSIKKLGERPALLIHSTEDSQVPYQSFERLVERSPSHLESWVREGDLHLIVEGGKFLYPQKDTVYAETIKNFLNHHFGGGNDTY